MESILFIFRDIILYFFILFVTFLSLREGYYGVKHQTCRVPLAKPPLYAGFGIEAVLWGTLYSLVGILYAVFMLESTLKLIYAFFYL